MATATSLDLQSSTQNLALDSPPSEYVESTNVSNLSATEWAELVRSNLENMALNQPLDTKCLPAPRRRHADPESAALAVEIAALLYPAFGEEGLSQVIKYEKDIVALRKAILAQEKAKEEARIRNRLHPPWKGRVKAQGPWDGLNDPLLLAGAPALPMPVQVSDEESLAPFFAHIGEGGTLEGEVGESGEETYYGVGTKEWEKGILYEDGRMDLCKMVLGPPNIAKLMENLKKNTFIRHFLLGNNMIGPVGARLIAEFVHQHPDNIETWYLAGNCIDLAGLERLVPAWKTSTAITNIWLKRNPLGPKAYDALSQLITETKSLRTVDLDQTEISDDGVSKIFTALESHRENLPLRNIYLNATGIGKSGCEAIGDYLSSPHCKLESLYMSCNPVGDAGAIPLAKGLAANKSLLRLSMTSCGLKSPGAEAILTALQAHPRLMALNIGQSYATEDLSARYNWLDDRTVPSIKALIHASKTLKMLELGTSDMTLPALSDLAEEVAESKTLVVFSAKSLHGKVQPEVKAMVNAHIKDNVERTYGMDVTKFEADEKRWLISPKDVRLIDSAYRNRDAGLARRGLLRLKKQWEDDGETVKNVMHADDAQLEA